MHCTDGPSAESPRTTNRFSILPAKLSLTLAVVLSVLLMAVPAAATRIQYDNCLDESYFTSNKLQWVPMAASASIVSTSNGSTLTYQVWGNVTGWQNGNPPDHFPENYWRNVSETNGKIADADKKATVYSRLDTLSYRPYNQGFAFCDILVNGSCPQGPVFNTSAV